MKTTLTRFPFSSRIFGCSLATALVLALVPAAVAQGSASNSVETQRQAMHKLAFLVGRWSGPVTVTRGPGEPLHLTQAEDVEYKLDGLVLLIQGKSTSSDGKVEFSALATISYDDANQTYHIRAYNDGHYVDTELKLETDGFSWGFPAGPAHIVNTMHLTPKGEWQERSEFSFGNMPPRRNVEMLLQHLS